MCCTHTNIPAAAALLPPLLSRTSVQTNPASLQPEHYFSGDAHWVIPGHLMQGRHPATSNNDDDFSSNTTADRINDILKKGKCSTFVCLQAEVDPREYAPSSSDDISLTSLGGLALWKTDPMEFESYVEDAVRIAKENDDAICIPQFVHYGIKDMNTAISLNSLIDVVLHLADRIRNKHEVIYMHCWGGKGRAGFVSACLLGVLYPDDIVDADEALERIQAYCNIRRSRGRRAEGAFYHSPETDEQKAQVREFYQRLKAGHIQSHL